MALQTIAPTAIPTNADLTFDRPTWGESGGPFPVPPNVAAGFGPSEPLPGPTVNYNAQHPARWIRAAAIDRAVMSDEGLFTSCVVRPGKWNIAGGTLDVTLQPARIVVDAELDGGIVLELYTPTGQPETLPALSDTYVDLDESGAVTVTSVGNGDPEPPLAAGFVRIYLLVTDAVELTDAGPVDGVAPFPCLGPTVGVADLQASNIDAQTAGVGTLTTETSNVTGVATVEASGSLVVENGAPSSLLGDVTIGTSPTDDLTINATVQGDIVATATGAAKVGYLELLTPGAPPTLRQLSTNASDQLLWNDGALNLAHYSPNGWVFATGDQEASTGLAATHNVATTTVAIKGLGGGQVRVIVDGMAQHSVIGNTMQVTLQHNQGGWSDVAAAAVVKVTKGTADANDWQPFRLERVFTAGIVTATLYRVNVEFDGGTGQLKEVRTKVTNERA